MTPVVQPDPIDRPTLTCKEISSPQGPWFHLNRRALLETTEFLKFFYRLFGVKVPRRTLQLYSSPGFKLLPLPLHKGGYKSYYLNPEHTTRLAVIMQLQKNCFFPLKAIQKVIEEFPEKHYYLILRGLLTSEEILNYAFLVKKGFKIDDILYLRVSRTFETIDQPIFKATKKFGSFVNKRHLEFVDAAVLKECRRFAQWIKAGGRQRLEGTEFPYTTQEYLQRESWLRATERQKEEGKR